MRYVLSSLGKYKDKDLLSADHVKPDALHLGDEQKGKDSDDAKAAAKDGNSDIQPVIDRFKEILGDRVIEVRVSERLVDSPVCLVGDDNQLSGHMEKMMRMMNRTGELPKRVMEINAKHSLIQRLAELTSTNAKDPFVKTACEHLFEGCMLLDGYLTDPHKLVGRMNQLLNDAASMQGKGE